MPPEGKQHLVKVAMGIQRGSGQYLLITIADVNFSLFPKSGKTMTVARKGKYFFLCV